MTDRERTLLHALRQRRAGYRNLEQQYRTLREQLPVERERTVELLAQADTLAEAMSTAMVAYHQAVEELRGFYKAGRKPRRGRVL